MRQLCVITGPTATGKTALGVRLARALGGEVISADSMQVYRRMDIGTAKPTAAEMEGVPHHMLDRAEPWEDYSAARYVREASACADDIFRRGKLPLLVGGSMLYIDSLLRGREFSPMGDAALRAALGAEYDRLGGAAALKKLAEADPDRAARLHPGDKKRIVRALEIYRLTGKTATQRDAEERARPPRYAALTVELGFEDRQTLYNRIDSRVDEMLRRGLIEEVRSLLGEGVPRGGTAMQAIGYKEIAAALLGELPMAEAVETVKRESRRLAKRQLSWLRARPGVLRIRWGETPDLAAAEGQILRALADPTGRDKFSGGDTVE